MIREYGADTVRVFMLFKAPPELDMQWDMKGTNKYTLCMLLCMFCVCMMCTLYVVCSYPWSVEVAKEGVECVPGSHRCVS